MRLIERRPTGEIASALGMSVLAARALIRRGVRKLKGLKRTWPRRWGCRGGRSSAGARCSAFRLPRGFSRWPECLPSNNWSTGAASLRAPWQWSSDSPTRRLTGGSFAASSGCRLPPCGIGAGAGAWSTRSPWRLRPSRVEGEYVPHAEKMFSVFEPHSAGRTGGAREGKTSHAGGNRNGSRPLSPRRRVWYNPVQPRQDPLNVGA